MKNHSTFASIARHARGPVLALALLLAPRAGAATETEPKIKTEAETRTRARTGWSTNLTPVLIFAKNQYRFGGGVDPELKYTVDLGGARLSAGGRIGGYYARNLFGVTLMPTMRLTVPVGPVEPYVAFGLGYGWLPVVGHEGFATMSRIGVVFRFSERFAIGVEGTVQKIDGSSFAFPSFGSMISIDL